MNKLVSIIVPIYNVENYIHKCLDSIINQTYKNIEIILVDDGSPDNCGKICDEYASKDERIKVIHKENEGLSAARNDGMDICIGEYVTFVDSDDYISYSFCKDLMNAINENDADIAICNVKKFVSGESVKEEKINLETKVYNSQEIIYNLISFGDYYECACGKIYSKKILEGIYFPIGRIYEDSATTYKLYHKANKIAVINSKHYYYLTKRADSIVGSKYTKKKQNDNYLTIEERNEYLLKAFPEMKHQINAWYIRNALTLIERTYLADDLELINSEILEKVEKKIKDIMKNIDKNSFENILNNYRLASLYLFFESKEIYSKTIKDLHTAKYGE